MDNQGLGGLQDEDNEIMDCLGCNFIETSSVTLRDGRIVCSSCEAWRLECEARHVLKKPDAEKRKYLEAVMVKRGEKAKAYLREEMVAMYKRA